MNVFKCSKLRQCNGSFTIIFESFLLRMYSKHSHKREVNNAKTILLSDFECSLHKVRQQYVWS